MSEAFEKRCHPVFINSQGSRIYTFLSFLSRYRQESGLNHGLKVSLHVQSQHSSKVLDMPSIREAECRQNGEVKKKYR